MARSAFGAAAVVAQRSCDVRASLCCRAGCCLLVLRRPLNDLRPRKAVRGLERAETVNAARRLAPGGILNQDGVTKSISEHSPERHADGSRNPAGDEASGSARGVVAVPRATPPEAILHRLGAMRIARHGVRSPEVSRWRQSLTAQGCSAHGALRRCAGGVWHQKRIIPRRASALAPQGECTRPLTLPPLTPWLVCPLLVGWAGRHLGWAFRSGASSACRSPGRSRS